MQQVPKQVLLQICVTSLGCLVSALIRRLFSLYECILCRVWLQLALSLTDEQLKKAEWPNSLSQHY
jgi:hypothetical protein